MKMKEIRPRGGTPPLPGSANEIYFPATSEFLDLLAQNELANSCRNTQWSIILRHLQLILICQQWIFRGKFKLHCPCSFI